LCGGGGVVWCVLLVAGGGGVVGVGFLAGGGGGGGGVCMCVCGLGSCASTQAVLVACMKLSFQKSEECLDCLAIRLKESLSSIHLVCS